MTNHAVIIISQGVLELSENQPGALQLNFSEKFSHYCILSTIFCQQLGIQMHFELPQLTDKCSNGSLILGDMCNSDPTLFLQLMLFSNMGIEQFSFQNTEIDWFKL